MLQGWIHNVMDFFTFIVVLALYLIWLSVNYAGLF